MIDIIKDKDTSSERTQIFHDQLKFILRSIFDVMTDSINLLCGDSKRWQYFPRLVVFMSDYEEAQRVCSIKQNYYIVYTILALRRKDVDPAVNRKNYLSRTSEESLRLRMSYKDQSEILKKHSYHAINLFTDDASFPGCSIYDSISLDLLHQASKNFYDQVFSKQQLSIIKLEISEAALTTELDARFQYILIYPGLRQFRNRISMLNRWTGKKYKGMMQVWMRVSRGLGGDILNSIVKEYLDIH